MPIHDWSRVQSGTFHDFHQGWTIEIRNALNRSILPPGYFAMADQRVGGPEPDVVALRSRLTPAPRVPTPETALLDRPRTSQAIVALKSIYARKANRISIRHHQGRVVAMIEIVSPGNKDSKAAVEQFVRKASDFLFNGIHFFMVDLFPPTARDPLGLHQLVWAALTSEPYVDTDAQKPLAAASYDAGGALEAFVEPLAVGDPLPDMPLFLEPGMHVLVPLEETYSTSWAAFPGILQDQLLPME